MSWFDVPSALAGAAAVAFVLGAWRYVSWGAPPARRGRYLLRRAVAASSASAAAACVVAAVVLDSLGAAAVSAATAAAELVPLALGTACVAALVRAAVALPWSTATTSVYWTLLCARAAARLVDALALVGAPRSAALADALVLLGAALALAPAAPRWLAATLPELFLAFEPVRAAARRRGELPGSVVFVTLIDAARRRVRVGLRPTPKASLDRRQT